MNRSNAKLHVGRAEKKRKLNAPPRAGGARTGRERTLPRPADYIAGGIYSLGYNRFIRKQRYSATTTDDTEAQSATIGKAGRSSTSRTLPDRRTPNTTRPFRSWPAASWSSLRGSVMVCCERLGYLGREGWGPSSKGARAANLNGAKPKPRFGSVIRFVIHVAIVGDAALSGTDLASFALKNTAMKRWQEMTPHWGQKESTFNGCFAPGGCGSDLPGSVPYSRSLPFAHEMTKLFSVLATDSSTPETRRGRQGCDICGLAPEV